jgi:CHAT domain-containing protein
VTESSGTSYATLPYLVKTNEVVYAPSASVVAALRKEAGAKSGDAILVVADPVFSANDPRAQKAAAVNQASAGETRGLALLSAVSDVSKTPVSNPAVTVGLPLARLYGTRIEAEQIAQLSRANGRQADLWLDFDASEANVYTRAIDKYRILHFATHGMLDAARPQFTGLVLSLIGRGKEDGFLRVEEVFNLRLGAPFVMLSACETGLGKEKRGEGVMGLTRAFMYAGAPTVGVSLWSVADRSTAELMNDLYPRLLAANTGKPAAALRAAQLKIMADERYSAPFFWAPFVLVGEWR